MSLFDFHRTFNTWDISLCDFYRTLEYQEFKVYMFRIRWDPPADPGHFNDHLKSLISLVSSKSWKQAKHRPGEPVLTATVPAPSISMNFPSWLGRVLASVNARLLFQNCNQLKATRNIAQESLCGCKTESQCSRKVDIKNFLVCSLFCVPDSKVLCWWPHRQNCDVLSCSAHFSLFHVKSREPCGEITQEQHFARIWH